MKRILLIIAFLFFPIFCFAHAKKVGAILYSKAFIPSFKGLKDGLSSLGYVEGKNINYFPVIINGNLKEVKKISENFKKRNITLIFTTTTFVALEVKKYINFYKFPVIFNEVDDPVLAGLVKSLNKPGGYFTGIAHIAAKLIPKRLEIFKDAFPEIKRIVYFYNLNTKYKNERLKMIKFACRYLNLKYLAIGVKDKNDLFNKMNKLKLDNKSDGLFWYPDALVTAYPQVYFKLSHKFKVPLMVLDNVFISKGGCIGYSPDFYEVGKQSSFIAKIIFDGGKPQNIPVEYPEKILLKINLKEIKQLGLFKFFNKKYLNYADEIIR